jgi:hypothetical protein
VNERDIRNAALADAIKRIESMHGNELYERAWKKAAQEIKDMMVEFNASITDSGPQISDSS